MGLFNKSKPKEEAVHDHVMSLEHVNSMVERIFEIMYEDPHTTITELEMMRGMIDQEIFKIRAAAAIQNQIAKVQMIPVPIPMTGFDIPQEAPVESKKTESKPGHYQ